MSDRILIVLPVFRPNPDHLRLQLASLRAQDHPDLHVLAVIADTVSGPLTAGIARNIGLPLTLRQVDFPQDAVRAFETGIGAALALARDTGHADAPIALCDQDDIWHPDRLSRGLAALRASGAGLVHSDMRLVDDAGQVLHPSAFAYERRHPAPGLRGLLYRNTITGMTVLMRADLARLVLPFPEQSGVHFYHDLWLGLVAHAAGMGVHRIAAPLVDYRQHGGNTVGAVNRQAGWTRSALAAAWRRSNLPGGPWIRREAASYALARYLAHATYHRMAEAVADGRLADGAARLAPLRPFLRRRSMIGVFAWDALVLALGRHGSLTRIAAGFGVVATGRWIWALRQSLTTGLRDTLEQFDNRLYALSPGVPPRVPQFAHDPAVSAPPAPLGQDATALIDRRKVPGWTPDFTAPAPAITVLVPTLNPTEIFAGIVTALDIGLGLAAQGHAVRFIATDLPVSSPDASRHFVLARLSHAQAASGAAHRVTLECGVTRPRLPAHRGDRFLATAWWSAHVAHRLIAAHGYDHRRFHYLIQDYEPNFYPWGGEYADAVASYALPFTPVFNTTLLRDYFALKGHGFAGPGALAFHPSIDIARYGAGVRPMRTAGPRRLALYGRPEVARNMFPTAIEALSDFITAQSLTPDAIEPVSVGLSHAPVRLPGGLTLTSLGKLPWEAYPDFLLGVDIGLSLMYSPHPSHPPLEMAASGVRVVTNSFGPKDLGLLSPAILSAAPDAAALAAALGRAWALGPVPPAARQIDLTRLGLPLAELIPQLARDMALNRPETE